MHGDVWKITGTLHDYAYGMGMQHQSAVMSETFCLTLNQLTLKCLSGAVRSHLATTHVPYGGITLIVV